LFVAEIPAVRENRALKTILPSSAVVSHTIDQDGGTLPDAPTDTGPLKHA